MPAEQGAHVDPPGAWLYCPAGHGLHAVCAGLSENVPVVQFRHTPVEFQYVPGKQGLHVDNPRVRPMYPVGQGRQVRALSVLLYVLRSHGRQLSGALLF